MVNWPKKRNQCGTNYINLFIVYTRLLTTIPPRKTHTTFFLPAKPKWVSIWVAFNIWGRKEASKKLIEYDLEENERKEGFCRGDV